MSLCSALLIRRHRPTVTAGQVLSCHGWTCPFSLFSLPLDCNNIHTHTQHPGPCKGYVHYVASVVTLDGHNIMVDWGIAQFAKLPSDMMMFV